MDPKTDRNEQFGIMSVEQSEQIKQVNHTT